MSGHNKWSKIKRGKETKDKARGNIFSKLSRLITLAVVDGGGITDPNHNVKLHLVIDKAKQFNMPKENINRAIERASGPNKAQLKEVIYEGFAHGGAALIIFAVTDNPNRTLSEVRNILEKHQGKLGNQGSVKYLFRQCGLVIFDKNKVKEDFVLDFAEKINGFDIEQDEDSFSVYLPFENLGKIKGFLNNVEQYQAEIDYKPVTSMPVSDQNLEKGIAGLIEALEQLDDVHRVFTNAEIKI